MSSHSLQKRHTSLTDKKQRLHPDEAEFCFWLSRYKSAPPVERQLEQARTLFGLADFDEAQLQKVKRSKPFRVYLAKLHGMTAEEAKEIARDYVEQKLPHAMASHMRAINMLEQLGEFKDIAKFTNPLLDRVLPKREDATATQAVQVVINMAPAAQAAMEAEVVVLETETISDAT